MSHQSISEPRDDLATEQQGKPLPIMETVSYDSLSIDQICRTIELLRERIQQRFPHRGISRICERLQEIASHSQASIDKLKRPILWLRMVIGIVLVIFGSGLVVSLFAVNPTSQKALSLFERITVLESGLNDIILISAGVIFLVTLENRIKRKQILAAVHELRSLVHIIDMHQLTKDPERLQPDHKDTESSPTDQMSRFELNRYLDYCSEMLSLSAKLAALYAQNFGDSVVLSAVGEVETLSTGLSNNVWQKIAILQNLPDS